MPKKTGKKSSRSEPLTTTTMSMVEDNTYDDVKLLFYQYSIAIDSIGKTAQIILKSFEQLYCTSVWE